MTKPKSPISNKKYFVCESHLMITNIEYCKQLKKRDKYNLSIKCQNCKIDFKTIPTKQFSEYSELQIELENILKYNKQYSNKTLETPDLLRNEVYD